MKALAQAIAALAIAALLIDALSPCSTLATAGNKTYAATSASSGDAEPTTHMIAACHCGCRGVTQTAAGLSLPAILPRSIAEVDIFPSERPSTPYLAQTSSAPAKRLHKVPRSLS